MTGINYKPSSTNTDSNIMTMQEAAGIYHSKSYTLREETLVLREDGTFIASILGNRTGNWTIDDYIVYMVYPNSDDNRQAAIVNDGIILTNRMYQKMT
ncbi:MAG: hypothetical protein ACRCZK_04020 [Oscillospiraceae bacterium]